MPFIDFMQVVGIGFLCYLLVWLPGAIISFLPGIGGCF